ncbi:DUF5320 domain-containing protein [Candidatus Woesearchaeota archaeon]|nr:DUF5320 domain-containing protein [Candidatus Woesearchaeota archaeon]
MPGFDRTGPHGEGPMTGGGFGYCTGNVQPGTRTFSRGGGFGRRTPGTGGRGRGYRNRFLATGIPRWGINQQPIQQQQVQIDKNQEMQDLENEKKALENELEAIKKRQEELKNRSD